MTDEPRVQTWDLTARSHVEAAPMPHPDARWRFDGGSAWVFLGAGNRRLTRPLILSDGFHLGGTRLDELWWGLELDPKGFPFASAVRDSGHDLVVLGYDDCTASILDNARVAVDCVRQAIAERRGAAPLAVGGFSTGGLVTRYALARLETEGVDHQTGLYVCYDSPHHGAWMPISIQALAHFLGPAAERLVDLVDSVASRQLMRYTIPGLDGRRAGEDEARREFLRELEAVGSWPRRPRKIGVANGRADGARNGVPAGETALRCRGLVMFGTTLYTQDTGDDRLVAALRMALNRPDVRTRGLPRADGAAGGTLESFGLIADHLNDSGGRVDCPIREVSFVPTGSAIAVTGLDIWENLDADVTNASSDLDEFRCASDNTPHTSMTEELCTWIIDRLPD